MPQLCRCTAPLLDAQQTHGAGASSPRTALGGLAPWAGTGTASPVFPSVASRRLFVTETALGCETSLRRGSLRTTPARPVQFFAEPLPGCSQSTAAKKSLFNRSGSLRQHPRSEESRQHLCVPSLPCKGSAGEPSHSPAVGPGLSLLQKAA